MKLLIFITSILCLIQSFSAQNNYPSHLPRCFRNDPNLKDCLVKAGQTVRPLLKNGVKEFGIPSVNPLVIPLITLEQETQKLSYKMDVSNYSIYGLDNYTIKAFDINLEKQNMNFVIFFGPLVSNGKCNFEGRVFLTSLKGRGTLIIETAPSTFSVDMKLNLIQKDGKEYIQVNSAKIVDSILTGKPRFENFEGANENIVKIFNKIIDSNSEELSQEVKPVIDIFLEQFLNQTMSNVFGRYSYDDILPSSI